MEPIVDVDIYTIVAHLEQEFLMRHGIKIQCNININHIYLVGRIILVEQLVYRSEMLSLNTGT